jgi:hypothetical protein
MWDVGDSRMSPNLLRGTGKAIGGDLDIDDEGSEQRRFELIQSLHHGSVGYAPASESRTQARTGKNNLELQMND